MKILSTSATGFGTDLGIARPLFATRTTGERDHSRAERPQSQPDVFNSFFPLCPLTEVGG